MAYRKCSACDLRHPPGQHVARLGHRTNPLHGQPPDTTPARPGSSAAGQGRDSSPGLFAPGRPPGAPSNPCGAGGDPEPYGLALSEPGARYRYGGDDYADSSGGIAGSSGEPHGPWTTSNLLGAGGLWTPGRAGEGLRR